MPPKVQKVSSPTSSYPESTTSTLDRPPDLRVAPTQEYQEGAQDLNPILESLVEKVEDSHQKLESLKPFLQQLEQLHLATTLQSYCDRLTEVEKSALNVDLGKAPVLPENLYLNLKSHEVFLTVLGAAIQALIQSFPTVFRGSAAAHRVSHLMTAVEVAMEAVEAVRLKCPRME